ncbi:hypothetical protein ACR79N_02085 [Sphingobacterium siyangense]|uniref:hypothetical protein n=1 Tax=Sphingobacterium siyangense TaxID=459529 RepID=UPI003DA62DAB
MAEKKKAPRRRLKNTRNVYEKEFREYTHFTGVLKERLGEPEIGGFWVIQGMEKNGKTWAAVMLAVYFSMFVRTLYISAEEGISKWFQDTLRRVGASPTNRKLFYDEYMPIEEIEHYVSRNKNRFKVVFLDNELIYRDELKNGGVRRLMKLYPDILWVVLIHEEKGEPAGATAKLLKKLCKVFFIVKGLRVEVGGRVPGGEFDLDEDGAELYFGHKAIEQANEKAS